MTLHGAFDSVGGLTERGGDDANRENLRPLDARDPRRRVAAGADMVGFVFFPKSNRHIDFESARALGGRARGRARIVALTVDPDDALLACVVAAIDPDVLQLHGNESPERVAGIGARFNRLTMKAIGVAGPEDLAAAGTYAAAADFLLIDAKPPKDAILPGGNGLPFDWRLVRDFAPNRPWLLSGGLDARPTSPMRSAPPAPSASTFRRASKARPASRTK